MVDRYSIQSSERSTACLRAFNSATNPFNPIHLSRESMESKTERKSSPRYGGHSPQLGPSLQSYKDDPRGANDVSNIKEWLALLRNLLT